jgi:stearoyl-CoA desaturase (delta-9 desaturase)
VANAKLDANVLKVASRWFHRDGDKVPAEALAPLIATRAAYPALDKMLQMREELRQIWLNTSHTREQLALDLQAWCKRAEDSGIAALREFSTQLRAART